MMDDGCSFCLRRALLSAVLWCVIVTVAETINQPIGPMSLHEQLCFLMLVGGSYSVTGLIWAVGAELPASRRRPLVAFVVQLVFATGADIALSGVLRPVFSHASGMARILLRTPLQDFAGHAFWANAFYGGLFSAAYHYTRQAIELRSRLARLRGVPDEFEMRLGEARLHHLHDQLRPATLIRALKALQARYIQHPATGDRLFDALVGFLRVAMPSVRGRPNPGSTASGLIEGYARLRNAIDPGAPRWSLAHDALSAETGAAPRRLLAVLDDIDGAIPEGRTIELVASVSSAGYAIRIRAEVEPEPAGFHRLLGTLHRLDARATRRPVPGTWLEIVLPVPPHSQCPEPAPEDDPLQHGGERVEHLA